MFMIPERETIMEDKFVLQALPDSTNYETQAEPIPRTGRPKRDRSKNRAQKLARRKNRGK